MISRAGAVVAPAAVVAAVLVLGGCRPAPPRPTLGPGAYVVGFVNTIDTQTAPGRYRTTGTGDRCTYALAPASDAVAVRSAFPASAYQPVRGTVVVILHVHDGFVADGPCVWTLITTS